MAKRLAGSKFGEGAGGPVQTTADPNAPTFDPASRDSATDKKIRELLSPAFAGKLTPWEVDFLSNVYGGDRLTQKQHIRVSAIHKRIAGS